MSANQHLGALLASKNSRLVLDYRPTLTPGPNELLIEVKAVAANPADYYSRDLGFPPVKAYPIVLGSDVAGVVLKAGSSVPADAPKPGTRIAAFATAFFSRNPDYAAF
jgi:NADPH:quinone reductase-like Zn-dependent oxidoreductase